MKILSTICLLLFMCLISIIDARISSSTKQLDRHITAKMKEAEIKPSGKSNDAEFLRRIHWRRSKHLKNLGGTNAKKRSTNCWRMICTTIIGDEFGLNG